MDWVQNKNVENANITMLSRREQKWTMQSMSESRRRCPSTSLILSCLCSPCKAINGIPSFTEKLITLYIENVGIVYQFTASDCKVSYGSIFKMINDEINAPGQSKDEICFLLSCSFSIGLCFKTVPWGQNVLRL